MLPHNSRQRRARAGGWLSGRGNPKLVLTAAGVVVLAITGLFMYLFNAGNATAALAPETAALLVSLGIFIVYRARRQPRIASTSNFAWTLMDPSATSTVNDPAPRERAGSQQARGSMDRLHRVLTQLLADPDSTEPFNLLLADILDLCGAEAGAIFVTTDTGRQLVLLACTGHHEHDRWVRFVHRHNLSLPVRTDAGVDAFDDPEAPDSRILAQWLTQGVAGHGLLLLRLAGRGGPQPASTIESLRSYGDYLAGILYSTRCARLKLRHAQSEERAAIARELHDSLAQSLSYLKIKASLLQSMLGRDDIGTAHATEVDATLKELRNTLNVAYRQLREIITTFRLTMHGKTFAQTLEESIDEFERRSSIAFDLDNRLPAGELNVAEEMQLVHIVREALSNVVRHSHATYCQVSLRLTDDGGIHVAVDDNGLGIQAIHDAEQHYGLIIMQERAHGLGGTLRVEARDGGGTRLLVHCPPRVKTGADTLD